MCVYVCRPKWVPSSTKGFLHPHHTVPLPYLKGLPLTGVSRGDILFVSYRTPLHSSGDLSDSEGLSLDFRLTIPSDLPLLSVSVSAHPSSLGGSTSPPV